MDEWMDEWMGWNGMGLVMGFGIGLDELGWR